MGVSINLHFICLQQTLKFWISQKFGLQIKAAMENVKHVVPDDEASFGWNIRVRTILCYNAVSNNNHPV